jgi:uncharacterized lipoprotein YddW (UPF0748 family)
MLFVLWLSCASTDDGTVRTAPTAPIPQTTPASETPGSTTPSVSPSTPTTTTTTPVELTTVSHPRELRGIWVTTVWNLDFPSTTGLSADALTAELEAVVDISAQSGFNALFFQVRPEGDALYVSDLEPWSRYLTGSQGADPGLDPLAVLIERAHAQGIEVHAWFNPFRAAGSAGTPTVAPHIASVHPELVYTYGSSAWMDPGSPLVRDHTVEVVLDVAERYAVDGVHFDDYFYPYPDGTPFPDDATYGAYLSTGGALGLEDWRRSNVNDVMERVAAQVPDTVRFGISPFGIYRPGVPEGIQGFDQYDGLFADPVHWLDQGWVDYLAPQLYWPSTQEAQAFGTLLDWWSGLSDRHIFAGLNFTSVGTSDAWSLDEYRTQLELSRAHELQGSLGTIGFRYQTLADNVEGLGDLFEQELYATPALSPQMVVARGATAEPPSVDLDGSLATPTHEDPMPLRAFCLYREQPSGFVLQQIGPPDTSFDLGPGVWALSAVTRQGVESSGVVVRL